MIKYIIERSKKNGQWYPRPVGRNGKVIFKEGYKRVAGALHAVKLVQNSARATVIIKRK